MVWYRYGMPGEGKKALGSEEGSALWRGCRADETRQAGSMTAVGSRWSDRPSWVPRSQAFRLDYLKVR